MRITRRASNPKQPHFLSQLRSLLTKRLLSRRLTLVVRAVCGAMLLALLLFTGLTVFTAATIDFPLAGGEARVAPFPVGVDPNKKLISENPEVESFLQNGGRRAWHLPSLMPSGRFARFIAKLSRSPWYQLAVPGGRLLVIFPGDRKEEVTQNFGSILGWNREERNRFLSLVTDTDPAMEEGKFYPGRYLVAVNATPEDVAPLINDRFMSEVAARYNGKAASFVPLSEALTVASLLEREGRDFEDMRAISGIIWNRLFINMPLQLDATLQYVKGEQADQPWWPIPVPADKYLPSPYNTYQNKGLPPGPIANPSIEAILAALNPAETDCLFYFHDSKANFHCSANYEEHVAKLRQIYGRGR